MASDLTIAVCTGRSGERIWRGRCPWCCVNGDRPVTLLVWDVYGGYCGIDALCGRCGFSWSSDDDRPLRDIPEERRQENIRRVKEARRGK